MEPSDENSHRCLVLAPIGRDGPTCVEVLRKAGLDAHLCKDFDELLENLDAGAAAVLVTEEGLFNQDISRLFDWIARQAPWSDLPFVILTSHLEQPAAVRWRQELVASLRNVSLLERPVQTITLTSSVQAATRSRQHQYQVRDLLEAQRGSALDLERLVASRTSELEAANEALRTQMEERARIEASLRQAQKIEAIGQLTGGVAHDFNNLLMVILGGLEMLDRRADSERRKLLLDGMRQAAQRGAGLTRQLLAFSRMQPLHPQPIDLAHQIGGMRELLDRSLGGDVHVAVDIPRDIWPIEVDPGELELAVLNLAVNARDAMPKGGTIVIQACNVPEQTAKNGGFVRLAIIDSGVGMTTDVQERAFEPFFTTKEVGKGSGLGLGQVYGFAKQSGGSVRIESEIDRGTSVVLTFPRSAMTPSHPAQASDSRREPTARGSAGRVLLVEDNDEVAALVRDMLNDLGYEVLRVASPAAALGAMEDSREIDIVFSDVMMPGEVDGVELGTQLRRRRNGMPVLLTSGYAESFRQRAAEAGLRLLAKPYQLADLAAALSLTIEDAQRDAKRTVASKG